MKNVRHTFYNGMILGPIAFSHCVLLLSLTRCPVCILPFVSLSHTRRGVDVRLNYYQPECVCVCVCAVAPATGDCVIKFLHFILIHIKMNILYLHYWTNLWRRRNSITTIFIIIYEISFPRCFLFLYSVRFLPWTSHYSLIREEIFHKHWALLPNRRREREREWGRIGRTIHFWRSCLVFQ